VDSGGPQNAQVQSYSPGGANVPSWQTSENNKLINLTINTEYNMHADIIM